MIPCDDSLHMDALQLEQAVLQDEKSGKKPFLVVATEGTTMEDGFACVLTTQLKGRTILRICSIHPETTEEDIRHTIQRMDKYARALKEERVPNFS